MREIMLLPKICSIQSAEECCHCAECVCTLTAHHVKDLLKTQVNTLQRSVHEDVLKHTYTYKIKGFETEDSSKGKYVWYLSMMYSAVCGGRTAGICG